MKKIYILVLMALVGIGLAFSNLRADEARTITHKTTVATPNTVGGNGNVVFSHGVTIYKITGYASSANAVYGLYDTATADGAVNSTCRVEGGEATQYDSLTTLDFGPDGLRFATGLVSIISGANITIEYE